jgi:hypothetical protein
MTTTATEDKKPRIKKPRTAHSGWTILELSQRWRVSKTRVRQLIRKGTLRSVVTGKTRSGKPRYVVLPEALAEYERGLEAPTPPKQAPRRKRQPAQRDFYPD